ncbi:hypothetical protein M9Y10_009052 [Tritrichomonas musculus]|uniref:Myb-like DNA-binding domain containing protein n=1 Tax=Tritrichomonas musculus TaxID=1915356 RepID=A0ABR2J0U8_9EUKA
MTDIAIFPFSPQEIIKIEPVGLDCNQMNQLDFKSSFISENSSQASSGEIELETEIKVEGCSIHVENTNEHQNNSYNNYNQNKFNNNTFTYNNGNSELNEYKCNQNCQKENGNISYVPWSPEEDEAIKDFMKKDQRFYKSQMKESMANVWSRLASIPLLMHNKRSAKDIKRRWILHLDPFAAEERIKGPWTIEEDILLVKLHDIYGNSWSKIAFFIPGRTEPSIKTRWNSHLKTKLKSKIEGQNGAISSATTTMISTPSSLLNSLFQDGSHQNQSVTNSKTKNISDFKSSFQYLIIDDFDNDLTENLILDDRPLFLEVCKAHKKAKYDNEQNKDYQPNKSNVNSKNKSILFDNEMLPQINSPNMNYPFTFFGPWPNIYSSHLNSAST